MCVPSPRKKPYVRRGPKTVKKKVGKPRGEKRIQADAWLDQFPIFRRMGFQINHQNTHPLYEDYCKHMYDNTSFGEKFSGGYKCLEFRRKLSQTTYLARSSSGIVAPCRSHVTGMMRGYGTSQGASHSEKVKRDSFFSNESIEGRRRAASVYNKSEHGQVTNERYSERQKKKRKEMCGAFVLTSGEKNQDFCGGLMNTELQELGNRSAVDYATNVSGVYVWISSRKTKVGIAKESMRFLTDGQKKKGGKRHNAVLMKNPHGHTFEDNTCPYDERFDHGLKSLTMDDCQELGIKSFPLVDDDMTLRDALKIEQMCHYEINHLRLGQRLHRKPGSGVSLKNNKHADVVARRMVGITFLPPLFFERNPKICIVASAN